MARALTGWRVDWRDGVGMTNFRFDPARAPRSWSLLEQWLGTDAADIIRDAGRVARPQLVR